MNLAEVLLLSIRCVAHFYILSLLNFTHIICKRNLHSITKKRSSTLLPIKRYFDL